MGKGKHETMGLHCGGLCWKEEIKANCASVLGRNLYPVTLFSPKPPHIWAGIMVALSAGSPAILTNAGGIHRCSCLPPNGTPLTTSEGMWEPGMSLSIGKKSEIP